MCQAGTPRPQGGREHGSPSMGQRAVKATGGGATSPVSWLSMAAAAHGRQGRRTPATLPSTQNSLPARTPVLRWKVYCWKPAQLSGPRFTAPPIGALFSRNVQSVHMRLPCGGAEARPAGEAVERCPGAAAVHHCHAGKQATSTATA